MNPQPKLPGLAVACAVIITDLAVLAIVAGVILHLIRT
jgi:hypothetical protein